MMIVFQEELDKEEKLGAKMIMAKSAVISLARYVKQLQVSERQLSLVTDIAIVDSEPKLTNAQKVRNIGIQGIMQDVHGITLGDSLPLSISIDINVLNTFEIDHPDDRSYHLQTAITPISAVQYIERLSA